MTPKIKAIFDKSGFSIPGFSLDEDEFLDFDQLTAHMPDVYVSIIQ